MNIFKAGFPNAGPPLDILFGALSIKPMLMGMLDKGGPKPDQAGPSWTNAGQDGRCWTRPDQTEPHRTRPD